MVVGVSSDECVLERLIGYSENKKRNWGVQMRFIVLILLVAGHSSLAADYSVLGFDIAAGVLNKMSERIEQVTSAID
jgi:hypothetical protein